MSDLPHRHPISIDHIDIGSYLVTLLEGANGAVPGREPGSGRVAGGGGTAQHLARRQMYHHHIIFVERETLPRV